MVICVGSSLGSFVDLGDQLWINLQFTFFSFYPVIVELDSSADEMPLAIASFDYANISAARIGVSVTVLSNYILTHNCIDFSILQNIDYNIFTYESIPSQFSSNFTMDTYISIGNMSNISAVDLVDNMDNIDNVLENIDSVLADIDTIDSVVAGINIDLEEDNAC